MRISNQVACIVHVNGGKYFGNVDLFYYLMKFNHMMICGGVVMFSQRKSTFAQILRLTIRRIIQSRRFKEQAIAKHALKCS